jgi:hypothetical protein
MPISTMKDIIAFFWIGKSKQTMLGFGRNKRQKLILDTLHLNVAVRWIPKQIC